MRRRVFSTNSSIVASLSPAVLGRFLVVLGLAACVAAWGMPGPGGFAAPFDSQRLAFLQEQFPGLLSASSPAGKLPARAPVLDLPLGVRVLILLGMDGPEAGNPSQAWQYPARSDSLMLVFYHPRQRLSLVSLPRDLYLYMPGWGMAQAKWVFSLGGWRQFYATIEYNLGVRPHDWALVDFDGFISLVDALGGVEFVAPEALDDCGGIPASRVRLDGRTALCYVRSRFTTSDFERSTRQRLVLLALWEQAQKQDLLAQLPTWYLRYASAVHSSLELPDLLTLAPFWGRMRQAENLHQIGLEPEQTVVWRAPDSGAEVLIPDIPAIQRTLIEEARFAAGQ